MAERKAKLQLSCCSTPLLHPSHCLPQVPEVQVFGKFGSSTENVRACRAKPTRFASPKVPDTPGPGSYSVSSSFELKATRNQAKVMSVRLPMVAMCAESRYTPANSSGLSTHEFTETLLQQPTKTESSLLSIGNTILPSVDDKRSRVHMINRSLTKFAYRKLGRPGYFSVSRLKPDVSSDSRQLYEPSSFEGLVNLKILRKEQPNRKRIRILRDHPQKAQSVARLAPRPDEASLPKVRGLQLRRGQLKRAHIVVLPNPWLHE